MGGRTAECIKPSLISPNTTCSLNHRFLKLPEDPSWHLSPPRQISYHPGMRIPKNLCTSRHLPLILVCLGSFLLGSCALSPQPPAASEIPLRSVAAYYHRAGSLGADFEQFKLTDSKLFFECGLVSGGRHAAKQQRIVPVSTQQLAQIKSEAWQVRRYVEELHAQFTPPGTGSSLFDPGKLSLTLQFENGSQKIETSFDSVASGTEGRAAVVKALVQSLRSAAGDSLCGKSSFYGFSGRR